VVLCVRSFAYPAGWSKRSSGRYFDFVMRYFGYFFTTCTVQSSPILSRNSGISVNDNSTVIKSTVKHLQRGSQETLPSLNSLKNSLLDTAFLKCS